MDPLGKISIQAPQPPNVTLGNKMSVSASATALKIDLLRVINLIAKFISPSASRKIEHHIEQLALKLNFGDSYLESSSNRISHLFAANQPEFANELAALKEQLAPLLGTDVVDVQTRDLPAQVKEGVCAGACLDFARQIHQLGPQGFEVGLVRAARQFKSGIGAAATANQVMYQAMKQAKNLDEAQLMRRLGDMEEPKKTIVAKAVMLLLCNGPELSSRMSELQGLLKGANDPQLSTLVVKLAQTRAQLTKSPSSSPYETMRAAVSAHLDPAALSLLSERKAVITLLYSPNVAVIHEKTAGGIVPHALPTATPRSSPLSARALVELQAGAEIDQRRFEMIANSRNMSLRPLDDTFGTRGAKSDADYLQPLASQPEGTYQLVLQTEGNQHSTLFVKKGDSAFFWDPNFGLFKCSGTNPEAMILRILERYPAADRSQGHNLVIRNMVTV